MNNKWLKGLQLGIVDMACGYHISSCHIGEDKKYRKGVKDNSYFPDFKTAEKCFIRSFDDFNLKEIEKYLKADYKGDVTLMCFGNEAEIIGTLYQKRTKKESSCIDWNIGLEFRGSSYINTRTGLPFDVKTLFPINENNG